MAKLYSSSNTTAADVHMTAAASLKAGVLDLLWDSEKVCLLFFYLYFESDLIEFRVSIFLACIL